MKELCNKYLKTVLDTDSPLTGEVAAHVAHCPACAALRRDAELLCNSALPVTPEPAGELDDRVLRAVREDRKRRRLAAVILRRILPVSAAAAAAIVIAVRLTGGNETMQRPMAPPVAATVTEQPPTLMDWTQLEQESYCLDQELNSRQYALNNWI